MVERAEDAGLRNADGTVLRNADGTALRNADGTALRNAGKLRDQSAEIAQEERGSCERTAD